MVGPVDRPVPVADVAPPPAEEVAPQVPFEGQHRDLLLLDDVDESPAATGGRRRLPEEELLPEKTVPAAPLPRQTEVLPPRNREICREHAEPLLRIPSVPGQSRTFFMSIRMFIL